MIKEIISNKSPFNYYRLCTLLAQFIKSDNYDNIIRLLLKSKNFFKDIKKYMIKKDPNPKNMAERLYSGLPISGVKRYLDFGCGKCDATYELGKLLGAETYGTDIKQTFEGHWDTERNKGIKFAFSTKKKIIPFGEKFGLITANMVLHHIDPRDLARTLKEIYKALEPGGYFLIREHNCVGKIDCFYADLIHTLYALQNADEYNEKYLRNNNNYMSSGKWTAVIEEAGFRAVLPECIGSESASSPARNYFALYKK
jgi:SAM-dependent methyltransferase